jgi:hypothetical protein
MSSQEVVAFPTIIALGLNSDLLSALRTDGYLVLEAVSEDDAVLIARTHSRNIHLALTKETNDGRTLRTKLQHFCPSMHVLSLDPDEASPDASLSERLLKNVRDAFAIPDQ